MDGESKGGKYQRVKGGKSAEKSSVLSKVMKRNVDTICRKLSLKCHLLLHKGTQDEKSRELKSRFSTYSCSVLHMSGNQKPAEASNKMMRCL